MAAGLTVAGTDYLGIREAVGPQGYEFLARPYDASALADQIIRLAVDPALRSNAGIANRHRVENEFSPRKMYHEMTTVIREELHSK
jgi:glycosyltransferase involved in cell wall biosynthesis